MEPHDDDEYSPAAGKRETAAAAKKAKEEKLKKQKAAAKEEEKKRVYCSLLLYLSLLLPLHHMYSCFTPMVDTLLISFAQKQEEVQADKAAKKAKKDADKAVKDHEKAEQESQKKAAADVCYCAFCLELCLWHTATRTFVSSVVFQFPLFTCLSYFLSGGCDC